MKRHIDTIIGMMKTRNIVPKLVSILLAVVLWAYISSAKSGNVKFRMPVTITGLEENYVVSRASHRVVVVEVQGNLDDLKNISPKNVRLFVDLSTAEKDVYKSYKIQYQKIDFTDDFKVELYPEEVKFLIEKKIERNVRIVPRYSGITPRGVMAGRIRVNPEYVKISGPVSMVNGIGVIYTDEISVDDKSSTFRQDIKIEKVNEESVEYSLSKVNALVPIFSYSALASADVTSYEIPVTIKNKKRGFNYLLSADKVKINVIHPENLVISDRSFTAYVDADEIDIDDDLFVNRSRIEVMGFVHVSGDSSDTDNGIQSTAPDSVQVIITKEK